jgi:hypothetical protein
MMSRGTLLSLAPTPSSRDHQRRYRWPGVSRTTRLGRRSSVVRSGPPFVPSSERRQKPPTATRVAATPVPGPSAVLANACTPFSPYSAGRGFLSMLVVSPEGMACFQGCWRAPAPPGGRGPHRTSVSGGGGSSRPFSRAEPAKSSWPLVRPPGLWSDSASADLVPGYGKPPRLAERAPLEPRTRRSDPSCRSFVRGSLICVFCFLNLRSLCAFGLRPGRGRE